MDKTRWMLFAPLFARQMLGLPLWRLMDLGVILDGLSILVSLFPFYLIFFLQIIKLFLFHHV